MGLEKLQIGALVAARLYNVFYALIPDCDEVFNYYEPLNVLIRGFGKQTWEYSPEYAIRSWAYLAPYALLTYPLAFLTDLITGIPPFVVFYAIRLIIASTNIYAEHHMYHTLKTHCSQAIANWFIIFTVTATGMSHASIALLPSSLAMTCTTLATSNFIRYATSTHSTRNALLVTSWFTIGGLLGWPFALALAVPSMLYIIWDSYGVGLQLARYINWSIAIVAFYLVVIIEVDYWFYGRTVIVPLNIVLYNVVNASEASGPNIFGVEDVSYYIHNLLLNFNVVAVLGYLGCIMIPGIAFIKTSKRLSGALTFGVIAPIAIWTGVFFSQPHKEERFLYPIYTLIITSASITVSLILSAIRSIVRVITRRASFARLIYYITVGITAIVIATISLSRTISISSNYNTPLEVYAHIPSTAEGNVCVGREWYRYPSSLFLPVHARLQFVESGFRGLLPGEFSEDAGSLIKNIKIIPEGMNSENLYDPKKVISLEGCDYMIDINEPVDVESGEVQFIDDEGVVRPGWKLLYSAKFLDNAKSQGIGKYLYLPKWARGFARGEVVFHDYNLYQRIGLDPDDTKEPELEVHEEQIPPETGIIDQEKSKYVDAASLELKKKGGPITE
ncbi:CYFA0S05e02674g1_1 [Cyberlindnera fabianii]|uniref:Mannosyltransferase n=1 Tax=Cyberlindnera fabianii TaxID=36022 RepID=A0A061ATX6_CYBFA|nr:CYFA0S05e02674g1_1 [Cyberlindnera fabianii]